MYRPTTDPRVAPPRVPRARRSGRRTVAPNVWFLGLTSLVTDVASEMVTSILPAYTVLVLGFSPATFGLLDGLHQGGASLARVLSGFATDHLKRYKEVAAVGYLASAVSRLVMLLVGASSAGLAGAVLIDRVGKGIRTAPRDALLSMSASPETVATAFGVHRTLDTIGATLGPIAAFLILRETANDYPSVLVASLAIALVGVAILVTYVRNPKAGSWESLPALQTSEALAGLIRDQRLRLLVMCAGGLGAVTLADGMIYLLLQRRVGLSSGYIPLLFVATPGVYALLASPVGWLGDRIGKGVVFVIGYGVLALLYALLLLPSAGWATIVLSVALLGAYYAATDGILPAVASTVAPAPIRATAIAFVGTALDVGRLLASVVFGTLWAFLSPEYALGGFLGALVLSLAVIGPRLVQTGGGVKPA